MMELTSIIHFYGTNDLTMCHDFYVNRLGFTLVKDQGTCHIYQLTDSSFIGFCEHIPTNVQPRSPIITFVVKDVYAVYDEWSKWMDIERPSISQKFQIEHFFAEDPNGYTLEVQRFL